MDNALPQAIRAHIEDHPVMQEIMQSAVHQVELESQVNSAGSAFACDVDALESATDEINTKNKQVLNHGLC